MAEETTTTTLIRSKLYRFPIPEDHVHRPRLLERLEQRDDILAAGCNEMITKPFQDHEIFEMMSRFLDIEYIYEEKREAAPARVSEVELTSSMLADLPPKLLQELSEACLAPDTEAVSGAIKRIEPMAPDTAKDLRILLDNFQIGEIRHLLGKK